MINSTCRQEIYSFFEINYNFLVISKLSKKERSLIATVVNGKLYAVSTLRLIVPSIRSRVSDYMLAFGDFIRITFKTKKNDPLIKRCKLNMKQLIGQMNRD